RRSVAVGRAERARVMEHQRRTCASRQFSGPVRELEFRWTPDRIRWNGSNGEDMGSVGRNADRDAPRPPRCRRLSRLEPERPTTGFEGLGATYQDLEFADLARRDAFAMPIPYLHRRWRSLNCLESRWVSPGRGNL